MMNEPKSLDSLFTKKIFRIPDYQRGYAWQKSQLMDFWEDLINLSVSDKRSHYTGVLTLKEITPEITDSDNEYWLVKDHKYKMYHIVDGQQRLTTFVVFLQAFIDFIKQSSENAGKSYEEIYITDSISLKSIIDLYLFKTKPTGPGYRTYKFGYIKDNPSYEYLKHEIFNESDSPSIKETFYTLNLKIAKRFFYRQLEILYSEVGLKGLRDIYKKLTEKFLFNEYVIKDEFDVFVAFETMNNRGKQLSGLELLKNRLIYLTTLYTDKELDESDRRTLRDAINNAWKEVYSCLGRNDKHPLNDDDFLKAHWIMYFQYHREKRANYIKFLLDEQFSPQKIHKKTVYEVDLKLPEEQRTDFEIDNTENENSDAEEKSIETKGILQPADIDKYVNSLKESAAHWFNSHFPHLASGLSGAEKNALDQLNRIGMGYFRPLVMSVLKNEKIPEKRTEFLNKVERFIFIVFRLSQAYSNYGESTFYKAAYELDQGKLKLEEIEDKLEKASSYYFNDDGTFNSKDFHYYLHKKFNEGAKNGYYDCRWLRYFLYEYELDLLSQSREGKVGWGDLLKNPRDQISIEHIFPQTPTDNWKKLFKDVDEKDYSFYSGSIGNLLLLSKSINSSLQNYDFDDKKKPKFNDAGEKIRNGYSDGSHSEIKVSDYENWLPESIKSRGLELLGFMEKRWHFKFKNEQVKEALLAPKDVGVY